MDPLNSTSSLLLASEHEDDLLWHDDINLAAALPIISSLDLKHSIPGPDLLGSTFHLGLPVNQAPNLEQQIIELRNQNAELTRKNSLLGAQCNTLREANGRLEAERNTLREVYHALLDRLGVAQSVTPVADNTAPQERTDFPNINFWFKSDWKKDGDGTRGGYVETEGGDVVDKDRAREMRKSACNIWLAFEDEGSAPATWRQASTQVRKKYYESMSSQFPELKLCDMDWKAEQLASDNYSSWHSYRARIKLEKDSHHRSKRLRTDASELNISGPGFPVFSSLDLERGVIPDVNENTGLSTTGLPMFLTTSSEPIAGSSFESRQVPPSQAGGNVFALSNPFLGSQAVEHPAFDNLSAEERKLYEKLLSEKRLARE